jgi:hypothetical protein
MPGFIKIGSGIQNLMGWREGGVYTNRKHGK